MLQLYEYFLQDSGLDTAENELYLFSLLVALFRNDACKREREREREITFILSGKKTDIAENNRKY